MSLISAFGSRIIEFNVENSMFIMRENNGIKVYDDNGNLIKKDYEDNKERYFSYYEYM